MKEDPAQKKTVLGPCQIDNPLVSGDCHGVKTRFVEDSERVLVDISFESARRTCSAKEDFLSFEKAGPREKIFFDPSKTRSAIVTCGGICPGINDVIRAVVMTLYYRYGVREILGIRNGYQGLVKGSGFDPIPMDPEWVDHINHTGGTVLGTSRGAQPPEAIADFIAERRIDQLFTIGGDGTMKGASAIASAAEKRGLTLSVVGIPKTVDNDILFIDRSFGFISASSAAGEVVETAHAEAKSQHNGIGLVKLMGRDSGFISCLAALASGNANFVLVPEVPFDLEGEKGFLKCLEKRILERKHAVILVSEGAGQEHIPAVKEERDASGNVKFQDIGPFLRDRINAYFKSKGTEVNLKYIDPSYMVRAIGPVAVDSAYCYTLGENAVHAAMAGRNRIVIGIVNNRNVHIPMDLVVKGRRRIDPEGELWFSVLEATGQPARFKP